MVTWMTKNYLLTILNLNFMRERHYRRSMAPAESDPANEVGENFINGGEGEDKMESAPGAEDKEMIRESNNVADLLDSWQQEYQQIDDKDEDRKNELAYRMLRMEMALGAAKLDAKSVKIREDGDYGTLGFYLPSTGEIVITPQGLELPPAHFADVFVHESIHAGRKTGGRRIFDEGVAEMLTGKMLPHAKEGFYEAEQRRVEHTFGAEEIPRVLKLYDIDSPTNLVNRYLAVELKDRWDKELKGKQPEAAADEGKFLGQAVKNMADIKKQFQKGVPDLFDRLKQESFNFRQAELKILRRLARQR